MVIMVAKIIQIFTSFLKEYPMNSFKIVSHLFISKSNHHPANKKIVEWGKLSFCPKRAEGHYTVRISLTNYCLLWFNIIESILAFIFFSLLIFSIISRAFSSGFRFSKLNELPFQVGWFFIKFSCCLNASSLVEAQLQKAEKININKVRCLVIISLHPEE